ncbi:MAG: ABC transporter ATP-binding protein/permease [Sphaerochaetaceae bacterium]|nr:ABC transporter ATP-binding protein/permease [Sphaerochaetaceae bacterium]
MDKENKVEKRSTWQWIFYFAGIKKKHFQISVILAFGSVITQMLPYFIIARLITSLMNGCRDISVLGKYLLWMALLWLLSSLLHALSTTASHKATFYVLGNMRRRSIDKLTRMQLGDVLKRSSGGLKNTLVERIDSIETIMAHVIPEFTSNLAAPLIIFIYLVYLDWRMALISLVTFPIGMFSLAWMMKDANERNEFCIEKTKVLNDTAVEYINGIEVIKVFGKTQSSYDKFVVAAKEAASSYVEWMRDYNTSMTMAMTVMPSTLIGILPMAGLLVMRGSLSAEEAIMCIILAVGLLTPIVALMAFVDDLRQMETIVNEVTSIITSPEQERPEVSKETAKDNTIRMEDVHFKYDEKEVLHGIDVEIKEGTFTALVGPSGSGKSTIARLISGLWDTTEGKISIGGVDVKNMSVEDFNSRVAYVSQDNYLFNDTVMENIRIGRVGASNEEVIEIAKASGCHDFIMELENGYETIVGGGGGHLSGGERQRISIARAMLKKAPIVILDEATAYTDPDNEAIIEHSVGRLVKGKTLIVIAHRLSTIQNADNILVIDDGRIVEQGDHQSLLNKKGLYMRMWNDHIYIKDKLEKEESV